MSPYSLLRISQSIPILLVKAECQRLWYVDAMSEHGERYFFTPFSETFCHVGDTMTRTNSNGWPAVARPSPQHRRSVTATSTQICLEKVGVRI